MRRGRIRKRENKYVCFYSHTYECATCLLRPILCILRLYRMTVSVKNVYCTFKKLGFYMWNGKYSALLLGGIS